MGRTAKNEAHLRGRRHKAAERQTGRETYWGHTHTHMRAIRGQSPCQHQMRRREFHVQKHEGTPIPSHRHKEYEGQEKGEAEQHSDMTHVK